MEVPPCVTPPSACSGSPRTRPSTGRRLWRGMRGSAASEARTAQTRPVRRMVPRITEEPTGPPHRRRRPGHPAGPLPLRVAGSRRPRPGARTSRSLGPARARPRSSAAPPPTCSGRCTGTRKAPHEPTARVYGLTASPQRSSNGRRNRPPQETGLPRRPTRRLQQQPLSEGRASVDQLKKWRGLATPDDKHVPELQRRRCRGRRPDVARGDRS